MKGQKFQFRPLEEKDLPRMVDWLNSTHLQKWWRTGKITQVEVRSKYLPRIFNNEDARPFIATLKGLPVGFIQYYPADEGDPNWWPDNPGPGVIGIDLFLGNEEQLNRGVGTQMVIQFVNFLFEDPNVNEIRVDPRPDNLRAIRCYEKAGFSTIGPITNPDGPAVMMVLKRQTKN